MNNNAPRSTPKSLVTFPVARLLSVLVAGMFSLAGCGVSIIGDNGNNGGGGGGTGGPPPPEAFIALSLVNLTNTTVVAELYVSTNALANPAEDLFDDDNLFTDRVGIAATGLLAPLSSDDVEIPCTPDLVVGTAGGRFLDNETGELLGTGSQRVLQQGLVFDCGARVTLLYRSLGSDEFTVDISLE